MKISRVEKQKKKQTLEPAKQLCQHRYYVHNINLCELDANLPIRINSVGYLLTHSMQSSVNMLLLFPFQKIGKRMKYTKLIHNYSDRPCETNERDEKKKEEEEE